MACVRRRNRLLDRRVCVRDATLIVIATEGEKDEPQYFEMFKHGQTHFQLVILQTGADHASAPQKVLERLDRFAKEYQIGGGDELWYVGDVDRWPVRNLASVCRQCVQKGYHLAISNPAFECWIYLHFDEPDATMHTAGDFVAALREKLGGYRKGHLPTERLRPCVPAAIARARSLDTPPAERLPRMPGSHVYKLVEKLGTP